MQQHWGSAYTTSDWINKVHNLYLTASYVPTSDLMLFGTVAYNKSTGGLESVVMPDLHDRLGDNLEHMDYDLSGMTEYSKVDFALWRLNLGFDYRLSSLWKATVDVDWADLADGAQYVYGDESGSFYAIRAAARMNF